MNDCSRELSLAMPEQSLGLGCPCVLEFVARRGPAVDQTLSSHANPALPNAGKAALPQLPRRGFCLGQQQHNGKWYLRNMLVPRYKTFLAQREHSALHSLLKKTKLPFLKPFPGLLCPAGARAQDDCCLNQRERCTFVHFSRPMQPLTRTSPSKLRPNRNNLPGGAVEHRNRQPAALKHPASAVAQTLRVHGATCLPVPGGDLPVLPQIRKSRMEIHVYIPSGEDGMDCESLDKGFLEDVDNKLNSLSLQDEK
ncbi:PREDICTED: uncharacterized protein LOC109294040 [Gavialis gangeticus]|uniref:uncharacterized protein LOC109294040 n=1 Tax=Gavialis gangeticus TaxID=94835 RepID=UPI00092EF1A5|nr:PREDICTED: uncharacterized protein LOC109294040 [Gavialis gangeticus]